MSGATLVRPVDRRDHVAGNPDAPITLVEYGDFECPFCRLAAPVVAAARRELGDSLRVAFRHFPLGEIHPHARVAAQAAEAAAAQGRFWEMHDMLFDHQHALNEADLIGYAKTLGLDTRRFVRELHEEVHARRVSDDFRQGVLSGVNGTPTFFVNGERYDGSWADPERFIAALRRTAGWPASFEYSRHELQEDG